MTALIVCHACDVAHYDNCPTCFGFGVRPRTVDDRPVPISAGRYTLTAGSDWLPCPTCKSTPQGLPPVQVAHG